MELRQPEWRLPCDAPRPSIMPMSADLDAEARLRAMGELPDDAIDIGEAALLLGSFDRPRVGLVRAHDDPHRLAADAAGGLRPGEAALRGRIRPLNETLVDPHGYAGDALTSDDLQNANLLRVIDRRRALPVALGIIYL